MHNEIIKTKRLILRKPIEKDVDFILDFLIQNKEHFKPWDPIRNHEYFTRNSQLNRIRELQSRKNQIKFYLFEIGNEERILGEISISNIVRGVFNNCNIAYKLNEKQIGKGYMTEALEAVKKYIFEVLKLHRIEANIIPRNKRSIQLITRLGFRKEGLAIKLLKINGKWEDHFRYAFISEDYK